MTPSAHHSNDVQWEHWNSTTHFPDDVILIHIVYTLIFYELRFQNSHNDLTSLFSYNRLTIPYLKYLEPEMFGI